MQERVLILGLAESKQQAVLLLGVPLIITSLTSTWKCHIKSSITNNTAIWNLLENYLLMLRLIKVLQCFHNCSR